MSCLRNKFTKLTNQKGAVVVDYLLTTAMIAGILVPIILKYGGESFTSSLLNQRQKMVTFLAQDRKQNVPNSWFSQELTPEVQGNNPNISVTQNISEGDSNSPDDISTGGDPKVANLSDPNGNKINSPDNINVGNPGGNGGSGINTGNTNGTGAGGSASGVGPGAAGGGATSGDFFSSKNGEENTAEAGARKNADGSIYGASGRGGASGEEDDGDFGSGSAEKEKAKKDEQGKDKSENVADSRKRTQDNIRLAEQQVERRRGEFDWWLLLKILIVCLIIFLAVLIALSNLKRR